MFILLNIYYYHLSKFYGTISIVIVTFYLIENEVITARGRLKGALMEMLEPTADESDESSEYTPVKQER